MKWPLSFIAAALALSATTLVHAQGATATLSGTVEDPMGSVVPEAAIMVTSESTGLRREATTDRKGAFTVPFLAPGRYTVTARRAGFSPTEVKAVLQVGDEVTLRLPLRVAGLAEDVVVAGEAAQLSTSPAVSTVVDRQFIENLPMNGRSFQSLIALTPGVTFTRTTFGEEGQFSVNGQRANANYFTVDGVSANIHVAVSATLNQTAGGSIPGASATGATSNLVSVDALEEFRIQTSTFAPEFGRTPGAQVSIVTRAGTNALHGSAYEYFRDDALDAADWFANRAGLSKPPIRQHDFGMTLGGPLVRNRTFFFASYEGLRLRQPQTRITDVPSLAVRDSAPAALQPYLRAFPLPNGPETTNGFARYSASYSDPSTLDAFSLRLDHHVSARLSFFGRYNIAPSELEIRAIDNTSVNTITSQSFRTETATAGASWILTPRISNELRANWSRSRSSWISRLDDFDGAIPPPESSFFPPSVDPADSLLVFSTGGNQGGLYVGKNVRNTQAQINVVDSLSVAAGAHFLKFGVDYRRLTPELGIRNYAQFLGFAGAAGLATGRTTSASVETWDPAPLTFQNLSLYAQDTWRTSSRLTLTYGLRWDVNEAPTPRDGAVLYTIRGFEDFATMTVGPGDLYRTRYGNIAPRLGAAYVLSRRPGREAVLRGGGGLFYDLGTGPAGNVAGSFPNSIRVSLGAVPYPLSATAAAPPALRRETPIGAAGFRGFDPDLELPRTYQWNLSLEQSLGAQQSFTATYLGAAGRKLLRVDLVQSPNASFGSNINLTRNTARSDYHSLQLQFRRRLAAGLQALASYTWARAMDNASSDAASFVRADRLDPGIDRAPADFDVRHSFSGAVTYEFPRARAGALKRVLLDGWAVDTIVIARSAAPINVTTGVGNLLGVQPRPNLVPGAPLYVDDPTVPGGRRFNRDAFVAPTPGEQGTLGRNALRGFGLWQVDLALRRQVPLGDRVGAQLRVEMFNVFNHPNFGDPVRILSSGTFGVADRLANRTLSPGGGAGFNPLYQIGGPRSIQLSARVQF